MSRYLESRICTYLDGWRSQEFGLRLRFQLALSISRLSDEYIISRGLNLAILSYTYEAYNAGRLQFIEGGDLQRPSLKFEL